MVTIQWDLFRSDGKLVPPGWTDPDIYHVDQLSVRIHRLSYVH